MMHVNPYLLFDGDCRAAFTRYAEILGGDIPFLQTFGDSPACDETPPEWHDKILHVCLRVGDTVLMGSDAPPGHQEKPQGFSVALQVATPAEAERVFPALAEGGTVTMPLQRTFWAERFGMLVDRYGIPWMIDCPGDAATG